MSVVIIPLFATNATRKEKIKKEKLQWTQLHTISPRNQPLSY